MEGKIFHSAQKTEIVVVTGDTGLNARLQKLLKENNFQGRGFFDVEAAVNWSKLQQNSNIIYLLIFPFEDFSLDDTLRAFSKLTPPANCIALVDSDSLKKSGYFLDINDSLEMLPKSERGYEMIPAVLRQMSRRVEAEHQLTEFISFVGKDAKLHDKVLAELTEISFNRQKAKPKQTLLGHQNRKLKILLAEDDTINQMYLAGFLRAQDWEVDTVYNGVDAFKLYSSNSYDLIILDGQMPKMDGFETAQKIRNTELKPKGQGIPILAISGYANPEDKERFYNAGMDAYLSKPVDEQELIRVIHDLTK